MPGEVTVYIVHCSRGQNNEQQEKALWELLNRVVFDPAPHSRPSLNEAVVADRAWEEERICRLRLADDRIRTLVGAILSRVAIGLARKECRLNPLATIARRVIQGSSLASGRQTLSRPFVLSGENNVCQLDYNLSHHGEWVAVASVSGLPGSRVGIDLANAEDNADAPEELVSLFGPLLHPSESQWIRPLSPQCGLSAFACSWAVKEAVLKSLGYGFGGGSDELQANEIATHIESVPNIFNGTIQKWSLLDSSVRIETTKNCSTTTTRMKHQLWHYKGTQFLALATILPEDEAEGDTCIELVEWNTQDLVNAATRLFPD